MSANLGIATRAERDQFIEESKVTVLRLALAGAENARDGISETLAAYAGQSHPEERADVLKEALDAFGEGGDELIGKSEWAALIKAFRGKLADQRKSDRRNNYQEAVAKELEHSEAAFVDRVCEERLDGTFVYATGFGWMKYNGKHWSPVEEDDVVEQVRQFTVDVVADLFQQKIRDVKDLQTMMKKTYVSNVAALARGVLVVHATAFDANPDLLNCNNGTVDLRTGELRPHNAGDYFTKCAPTDYVPGATDKAWDQALSSMDEQTAAYMQLCYGNGATGHTPSDHKLRLLAGSGGNGKSMHIDGIGNALGVGKSGYFAALSDGALVSKNPDKEAIMSLRGVRIGVIEELPEGRHLNTVSLKRLVGTKRITGRHLYQKEITFEASHSFFVTSNYELSVNETDDGTWRRLCKVPFPYSYVDEPTAGYERAKDYTLAARLESREAREACLAWLVAGARRWYAEGLSDKSMPAAVREATHAWRADSDMVLRFFDEHLIVDGEHHIASSDLLKAFNEMMEAQQQSPWSIKTLTSRFKDHSRIKGSSVDTRKVRPGIGSHPVASRKPSAGYGMDTLPGQYAAWVGVRFRTEADDMPEPVADPIPASGVAPSNVVAFPAGGRDFDVEATELWAAADLGESDPWDL